jgi:dolichyl-phosphate beta-glucosyltransferase
MSALATSRHVQLAIPVRDAGERFARFVLDLAERAPTNFAADIVAIDDGSAPKTRRVHEQAVAEAADRLRAANPRHRIRLVGSTANRGKGATIRQVWGDGTGATWLGFVDGDGAAPAREVWRAAASLETGAPFDALLAVRVHAPDRSVRRTLFRAVQGCVFSGLVQRILDLGVRDPQCGLKFFRASALAPLLPLLREDRWLLDAEILLHLRNRGAPITDFPIDWTEGGQTGVVFLVDPLKMWIGLHGLRRRIGVVPRHDIAVVGEGPDAGSHDVRRSTRWDIERDQVPR